MTENEAKLMKRIVIWKLTENMENRKILCHPQRSADTFQEAETFLKQWKEPEDFKETLQEIFDNLKPREKEIITMHYLEGMSFEEIGEKLFLAPAFIKVVERNAILQFVNDMMWNLLMNGKKKYEDEMQQKLSKDVHQFPICYLQLSPKTIMLLHRVNCMTIGDILNQDSLTKLPRCGKVSANEIISALKKADYNYGTN